MYTNNYTPSNVEVNLTCFGGIFDPLQETKIIQISYIVKK